MFRDNTPSSVRPRVCRELVVLVKTSFYCVHMFPKCLPTRSVAARGEHGGGSVVSRGSGRAGADPVDLTSEICKSKVRLVFSGIILKHSRKDQGGRQMRPLGVQMRATFASLCKGPRSRRLEEGPRGERGGRRPASPGVCSSAAASSPVVFHPPRL